MKHAAEVMPNVYCSKSSSPSGVWYHFSTSKSPLPLIRITKVIWHESPTEYTLLGQRRKRLFGEEVTIWQRGWRYIKGARKIARQRRKHHEVLTHIISNGVAVNHCVLHKHRHKRIPSR